MCVISPIAIITDSGAGCSIVKNVQNGFAKTATQFPTDATAEKGCILVAGYDVSDNDLHAPVRTTGK